MNTYKITNITNLAGKRDIKYNSSVDIEYIDNMNKKTVSIKPNESIFLTVVSLPLSVQRLRVKNLITVIEVSPTELIKLVNDTKPKDNKVQHPKKEDEKKSEQKFSHSNKKKLNKKEEEVDIEKDE